MIKQTPWFERTFNFDFPVGHLPCILERLRGTPARLEDLSATVPSALLTTRVGTAWSIQEHIGHLSDLDDLHSARIDDYLAGKEFLRPADLTNRKTEESHHNQKPLRQLLSFFKDSRTALVSRLEVLDESVVARKALHPRLKQQMRLVDMAFFIAEHDDHHLAKIVSLSRPSRFQDAEKR